MKKLTILLSLIAIFTSCKKEYDCKCTTTVTASYSGTTATQTFNAQSTVNESSKKKAQEACDDFKKTQETNAKDGIATGGVQGVTVDVNASCSLTKK